MTLQGIFDFVEKGEGLEVLFIVLGGDGDLTSGGIDRDGGFVTRMSRVGPVKHSISIERAKPC